MQKAAKVVNRLLEVKDSDLVGSPINSVEYNGKKYTFYPYAGRALAWQHPQYFDGKEKGGLLGYIKTREGKIHGRFYTQGQFFRFEPGN